MDKAGRKGGYWTGGGDGEWKWVDSDNGWVLERDERELAISATLLHNVLAVDGISKVRPQDRNYVGNW